MQVETNTAVLPTHKAMYCANRRNHATLFSANGGRGGVPANHGYSSREAAKAASRCNNAGWRIRHSCTHAMYVDRAERAPWDLVPGTLAALLQSERLTDCQKHIRCLIYTIYPSPCTSPSTSLCSFSFCKLPLRHIACLRRERGWQYFFSEGTALRATRSGLGLHAATGPLRAHLSVRVGHPHGSAARAE